MITFKKIRTEKSGYFSLQAEFCKCESLSFMQIN